MSLEPLFALAVFLLPFLAAHVARATLSSAMARRLGRIFEVASWAAGTVCVALGIYCMYSVGQAAAPWNQTGLLGLVGFIMLGALLWTAFRLGYRVLVPANRFSRFAGQPIHILGWPTV